MSVRAVLILLLATTAFGLVNQAGDLRFNASCSMPTSTAASPTPSGKFALTVPFHLLRHVSAPVVFSFALVASAAEPYAAPEACEGQLGS